MAQTLSDFIRWAHLRTIENPAVIDYQLVVVFEEQEGLHGADYFDIDHLDRQILIFANDDLEPIADAAQDRDEEFFDEPPD